MPASPSPLIYALSCALPGAADSDPSGLPAALECLPDPRARRGVRDRLPVVLSAAVCAVVAGYRSYTAIVEWVDGVPATIALTLGIDPGRRPSKTMIRRLLQALVSDLLTAAISDWLTTRATTAPAGKRAIAVDGKTLRGSRTCDTQHVVAACDQDTGVVLTSTVVDGKTNGLGGAEMATQPAVGWRGRVPPTGRTPPQRRQLPPEKRLPIYAGCAHLGL